MFVWTVKLIKNADTDKYKYSGYGNGFDRKGKFSVGNEFDKNCIILGLDIMSSVMLITKKRYFNPWWRSYIKIGWYYINLRKNLCN